MVRKFVESGSPVDGPVGMLLGSTPQEKGRIDPDVTSLSISDNSTGVLPCETPFAIPIRHNAFHLASVLLSHNANPDALTLSSGLFTSVTPLTILGHIIISNARYSSARLKYLLNLEENKVDFIVEPSRQLTALHRAAQSFKDGERWLVRYC